MIEVALLILVAYLFGCIIGYAGRRIAHANSQDRYMPAILPEAVLAQTIPSVATPPAKPPTSSARRLARAAANDETLERKASSGAPAKVPEAKPDTGLVRPVEREKPTEGLGDDLKEIKGIGPKSESALHALNIYYFDQIAAWTPANVAWLDGRIAPKGRIEREEWIVQASLLAIAKKARESR